MSGKTKCRFCFEEVDCGSECSQQPHAVERPCKRFAWYAQQMADYAVDVRRANAEWEKFSMQGG